LQVQFTSKILLAAAWSTEIAGREANAGFGLDLLDFPRHRGNLKIEVEF
jgi:hypothetical protein